MAKTSKKVSETLHLRLDIYINADDQLVVGYQEPESGLEPIVLRPERGLEDLVAGRRGKVQLTLEVRDFAQRGTLYKVYAATLERDGRTVAAHWQPMAAGQSATFALDSANAARDIRVFIGALPMRPGAPEPAPLRLRGGDADGGALPVSLDPPPKGSYTLT